MRQVACFLGLLIASLPAFSQSGGTGTIQGTVTDPSGAMVAGAAVTATNLGTGVRTERKTTEAGFFVLSLLPAGEYSVSVQAIGFQTLTQARVVVDALAVVGLDLKLQIGAATQSVTVEAAPSMLKTDDVALGGSVENNVYSSLPLAMNASARDPSAFAGLVVGVNNYSTQPAGPSTGSFNGGQTYQNEIYIEGLPLTNAGTQSDTRNLAFGISVEAVEQFQVETTGAKAMYEGQGVSNYVLKSGGNQFHGVGYEYFRNTIFDARGFFVPTTPVEHQNEFGGSVSGPIKKNRVFFFSNYDGYRYVSATPPQFQSIPTAAERTGDFSAFPQVIYDPTTATGTNVRTPFPNNTIPSNRISPISQSLASYLPAPTNLGIQNNYLAVLPQTINNDSTTNKVDWNLSDKDRLFALFSTGKYTTNFTGSYASGTSALPLPYTQSRFVTEYSTTGQIHDVYTLRPNLVNEFNVSMNRMYIPLGNATAGGNYPTKAGLTGLPPGIATSAMPDINFAGLNAPISWVGTNAHVNTEAANTYGIQNNVLWTKGRHFVTAGFQYQALQDNYNNPLTGTLASFSFSNNETANFAATGTLISTTGLSYASYLLGLVDSSSVTQNAVAETGGRYKTYALYIQDDIKVSSRLTVNLGLRWNMWGTFTEVANRMSFFNPDLANPLAGGHLGALQFAGSGPAGCNCSTPVKNHYVNPGPRAGLAYRLDDKTVIRAGYSLVYAHAGGVGGRTNGRQGLSQLGFNTSASFSSVATGQPAFNWASGYPPYQAPPFFNPSYGIGFITAAAGAPIAGPSTAQTITYGDPQIGGKPPYYENWNFNIQRSFTHDLTLSVAYSGSSGHFLPGAGNAGPFTNQIPLQYIVLGPLLGQTLSATTLAQAQAVFPNIGIPFPNFTGTIAQALKPYPQYNGISNPWANLGISTYNALQATLTHRLSKGLTFTLAYTFSKQLDDLVGSPRNPFNNSLERAPGTIDHPHVGSLIFVYQLPFGAGHKLSSSSAVANAIISRWQISGLATYQSGAPLTIGGTCTSGGILGTCYPNYNPSFNGSVWINGDFGSGGKNVTSTPYLDKTAFVDPPAYTVGNIARSAPYGLFAPHNADLDLSVRREFSIRERWKLAFQADAFNINNAVHFAAPGTNIDAANFGTFTTMANQPRKLQFSGRITF
ncbi:MAG TPA: TonB-dependent receptor [Candidatus Acidoferrales bacterium]|nr:TonB-dependent receptor [Candidatus Acidoferrales bacterium]